MHATSETAMPAQSSVPFDAGHFAPPKVVVPTRFGRPQNPPTPSRIGPRRARHIISAVLLALACVVAAVLSLRAVFAATSSYPAVVRPAETVALNFPTLGYLESVTVSPGQHVRRGEVLAQLNPDTARAQVASAAAAVSADKSAITAAQQQAALAALRPQVSAQATVEAGVVALAKARLSADEARLTEAQTALTQDTIRSPVSGTVINVSGAAGDLVGPQGVQNAAGAQPIAVSGTNVSLFPEASGSSTAPTRAADTPLIQLAAGGAQVEAQVPAAKLARLRAGQLATATVAAVHGSFGLRLLRVVPDPVQSTAGTAYEVLFTVTDPNRHLLPGMEASLSFAAAPSAVPAAATVPASAVIRTAATITTSETTGDYTWLSATPPARLVSVVHAEPHA